MIILLCILISTTQANQTAQAVYSATEALYKQTGTEDFVNTLVQNLDKKYIPEDLNKDGAVVYVLLQTTIRHQLGWRFTF